MSCGVINRGRDESRPSGAIRTPRGAPPLSPLHWRPAGMCARRIGVSGDFLVTSLIVVATPGTGVLYTLTAGFSRGPRASVVAAFGCTLGIVPHMAAAILGLAALLHASALAFQTLKYLGVVYLLHMAWNTLREQGGLTVEADVDPKSTRQVIVSAILAKASQSTHGSAVLVSGAAAAAGDASLPGDWPAVTAG